MRQSTLSYPSLKIDGQGSGLVSHAGTATLLAVAEKTGLDQALSEHLAPWRKPHATHDPAEIVLDLAVTPAAGGDYATDIALPRNQPGVFGPVASHSTVHRTITALAKSGPKALPALATATATARATARTAPGDYAAHHGITAECPLIIDLDATLVDSHSDVEEHAAPTYQRGFGFHPLLAFIDHGTTGTGEPAAALLRPGNAGANTVTDHKTVPNEALKQLPWDPGYRVGRKVLVRTDSGGGTHDFLDYPTKRHLQYSIGFTLTDTIVDAVNQVPKKAWTPACNADGEQRDGAWVAELTGLVDLATWPEGMRLPVRKERPHPGAQLRFTDVDGLRPTAFVTNTTKDRLTQPELRHRHRARCEDRIRNAKDTGLRNLPFKSFAAKRVRVAIVELAMNLTT